MKLFGKVLDRAGGAQGFPVGGSERVGSDDMGFDAFRIAAVVGNGGKPGPGAPEGRQKPEVSKKFPFGWSKIAGWHLFLPSVARLSEFFS